MNISPSIIIRLGSREHYICLRNDGNVFFRFDFSKFTIDILSEEEAIQFVIREIESPMCAVYGLKDITKPSNLMITSSAHSENTSKDIDIVCSLPTLHKGTITVSKNHLKPLIENDYCNDIIIDFVSECLMRVNMDVYIPETVLSECIESNKAYNIN